MAPKHLSFGNIDTYYAVLKDTLMGTHEVFSNSKPFQFPCEALAFSSDYSTMYFARYSYSDGTEKIFHASQVKGDNNMIQWSMDDNPLSFCGNKYIYTHPTLSSDGKIMIFSSNMPESTGGMDLFITRLNGENWSDPINIGKNINTTSNEIYPFLDSENNLFFSSDRKEGNGGYDINVCRFRKDTWESPVNLSNVINTASDDVAFTIDRKDGKTAFFSVRQSSGRQAVQLIMVRINPKNDVGNLSSLSRIFTDPVIMGNSLTDIGILANNENPVKLPEKKETAVKLPVKKESEVINQAPVSQTKKEIPAKTVKVEEAAAPLQVTEKPKITQTQKAVTPVTEKSKDFVVYRVQVLSSDKSKGSYKVTLNGKVFSTFEYFYNKAYRTCIGELETLAAAKKMQDQCRLAGYPQAFVVVFKNNARSNDPALFK
jgi:hypothetical protein